jgi:surfactin synthase thioesterase subunit
MTRNLVPLKESGDLLVCLFPYAGGSASSYRPLAELFGSDVAVSAVQLPGRQDRWQEAPYTDFATLVTDLADELAAATTKPYILMGHSMGAAVAHEVARELRARHAREPALLVVSGAAAPGAITEPVGAERFSDDELIEESREWVHLPPQVRANPELLELVLDALRADLALADSYRHVPGPPLSCPISVFGGRADPLVPEAVLSSWTTRTLHRTVVHVYDGDHFFLWGREPEVVSAMLADLRSGVTA